jgi:hypothetical protein
MTKPTKEELAAIVGHSGPKNSDLWFSTFTGYQHPTNNFRSSMVWNASTKRASTSRRWKRGRRGKEPKTGGYT